MAGPETADEGTADVGSARDQSAGPAARLIGPDAARDAAARRGSPFFRGLYAAAQPARDLFAVLNIILAPLCVALFAAYFLAAPQQTIEIYRVLFESFARQVLLDVEIFDICDTAGVDIDSCFMGEYTRFSERGGYVDHGAYIRAILAITGIYAMAAALYAATGYAIGRLGWLAPSRTAPARWLLRWAPRIAWMLPVLAFLWGSAAALRIDPAIAEDASVVLERMQALDTRFHSQTDEAGGDAASPRAPEALEELIAGQISSAAEAARKTQASVQSKTDQERDQLAEKFLRHFIFLDDVAEAPQRLYANLGEFTNIFIVVVLATLGVVWGLLDIGRWSLASWLAWRRRRGADGAADPDDGGAMAADGGGGEKPSDAPPLRRRLWRALRPTGVVFGLLLLPLLIVAAVETTFAPGIAAAIYAVLVLAVIAAASWRRSRPYLGAALSTLGWLAGLAMAAVAIAGANDANTVLGAVAILASAILIGGLWRERIAPSFIEAVRRARDPEQFGSGSQLLTSARVAFLRDIADRRDKRARGFLIGLALTAVASLSVLPAIVSPDSGAATEALAYATVAILLLSGVATCFRVSRRWLYWTLVAIGLICLGAALVAGVAAAIAVRADLIVPVAAILGIVYSLVGLTGVALRLPRQLVGWGASGAALLGLALGGFVTRLTALADRLRGRMPASALRMAQAQSSPLAVPAERAPWSPWLQASTLVAFAAMVWLTADYPVVFSQTVGAIFLFGVFIALLALIVTQLRVWGARLGLRMILALILLAFGLSAFNLNDNHQARRIASAAEGGDFGPTQDRLCAGYPVTAAEDEARRFGAPACGAAAAFSAWLDAREDRDAYAGEPYPVYVVAAQGGGIYAAAHTVLTLSRLQAFCPRFAQHLFAISSVSGGSVGASMYASLAESYAENAPADGVRCPDIASVEPGVLDLQTLRLSALAEPGSDLGALEPPLRRAAKATLMHAIGRDMVSRDFLSPLFGAAFFPDFAQRFWPAPVPALSRARAIEAAFEASWPQAHGSVAAALGDRVALFDRLGFDPTGGANPLARGYLQHWRPDGVAPALILNTTETASGRRRVAAPFVFGPRDGLSDLRLMPLAPEDDMPLSAAASLSARFPWLTPAGWFCDRALEAEAGVFPGGLRQRPVGAEDLPPFDGPTPQGLGGRQVGDIAEDVRTRVRDAVGGAVEDVVEEARDFFDICAARGLRKVRVVDGGYFENSGVTSALELIQELEPVLERQRAAGRPVAIKLIVLTGGGFSDRSAGGLGEALGPIRAMMATRQARTFAEIGRAERELSADADARDAGSDQWLRRARIYDFITPLPLGWALSASSVDQIGVMAGEPSTCRGRGFLKDASVFSGSEPGEIKARWQADTNCMTAQILSEVSVSAPETETPPS